MNNFRVMGTVDVSPILQLLDQHEGLWNVNPDRLIGFNTVQEARFDDIWIHMPKSVMGMDRDTVMANLSVVANAVRWHPGYYQLGVKTALMSAFAALDGQAFGRVFISRLMPGQQIFEHVDQDLEAFARFHICLQNTPGSVFHCGGEQFEPTVGQVFWFDNSLPHSVINNSTDARLTMVVDLVTPLREYLFNREFLETL